jgi:ribosome recycling factor
MAPNVAGTVIRLVMPPMTEENRKNMAKVLHQKEEQAKISIRNLRDKIKTAIQNDEKANVIAEDEKRRQLEALDKAVAEWNGKIENITAEKEKEILTV